MRKFILVAGTAALALSGAALGNTYSTDGNAIDLAPFDDLYDGSLGSMASVSLNVGDSLSISDVNVTVDIEHTWAGDLTWKLMSPNGTLVDLVSRAGFAETADDGNGCCGESSDLVFGNIYTIDDQAGTSSETMGSGGDDPINSFSHYSSGFGNEFGLSSLNGENAQGVWTLYIGDGAGGDTGILDGFTLEITGVPAPGAFARLGLAGFAARRRRG